MVTHRLDTLILFVTSQCNARCRSCFYWEELNQSSDLSTRELERLSATMPRFNEIWLSGGEPTLRKDLVHIIQTFVTGNRVRSINLPVNGLRPQKLLSCVDEIFERCPALRVNLNLALDGIGDTHDRIRGVPGNFDRALESLDLLESLRSRRKGLRVHVNSVICRENLHEMIDLAELIRDRFELDGHYFQVIRGKPLDPELTELTRSEVEPIYEALTPFHRHYADRIQRRGGPLTGRVRRAGYLGVQHLYHQIQASNLDRHHRWPMPCSAGDNIVVVDANGDIRACELRNRLGNLREYDCDWNRFWLSQIRRDELRSIKEDGCWCTHVCFIHASTKRSPKAKYWSVPTAYLDERRSNEFNVAAVAMPPGSRNL